MKATSETADTAKSSAILNLAEWSAPKRENTKKGSYIVRRAPMNPEFRKHYKRSRPTFEAMGITVEHDRIKNQEVILWTRDPQSENLDLIAWRKELKAFNANLKFKVDIRGLYDYQETALKRNIYTLRKFAFSLEASDTGYGKTYVACAVARQLGLKLFVVAPKKARSTWKKTVKYFNTPCTKPFDTGHTPVGKKPTPLEMVAVHNIEKLKAGTTEFGYFATKFDKEGNPDPKGKPMNDAEGMKIIKWVWTLPPGVLVVVDECHRFKGRDSKNSEVLRALLDLKEEFPVLAMSATAANDPSAMRALGKALDLHDGSEIDFTRWARDNGCVTVGWNGGLKFIGGTGTLKRLHREIFPERGNRQRVADLDNFPETQIIAECYDMGENEAHMQEAYDKLATQLAAIEEKRDDAKNRLTYLLRCRQQTELLKVPVMVEMAQDALEEGFSVPIFVNFQETVDQLARLLKCDRTITGSVSQRQRDLHIEAFQANQKDARMLILNTQTGGESISLHDLDGRFPRFSIISPDWSSYNFKQVTGRTPRAGGKSKSLQRLVYAANTVEDQVCANVAAKLNDMATINDFDSNAGVVLFS